MSSYKKETKHPVTGVWEDALWIDDYFGHRKYGVKFSDGSIFNPIEVKMETREKGLSPTDTTLTTHLT